MKIAISKQAIIDALGQTDPDFDASIVEKLLDKMPTVYHKQYIEREYFENYYPKQYYTATNLVLHTVNYFVTKDDLLKFCVKENITKYMSTLGNILNRNKPYKFYLIARVTPESK